MSNESDFVLVTVNPDGDCVMGLYYGNTRIKWGDDYHNSIRVAIPAFLEGVGLGWGTNPTIEQREYWSDAMVRKYCEDGCELPERLDAITAKPDAVDMWDLKDA